MESCQSKLVLTWDPTASVITVRYTTANDYVSNPISASKSVEHLDHERNFNCQPGRIWGKRVQTGKQPNNKNTPSETTPPPFFSLSIALLFPVYTLSTNNDNI
jgi:hypothetical protein